MWPYLVLSQRSFQGYPKFISGSVCHLEKPVTKESLSHASNLVSFHRKLSLTTSYGKQEMEIVPNAVLIILAHAQVAYTGCFSCPAVSQLRAGDLSALFVVHSEEAPNNHSHR